VWKLHSHEYQEQQICTHYSVGTALATYTFTWKRLPMIKHHTPANNTRIGFHYFPDTLHFRDRDLSAWLPELKSLGAQWITLVTPPDRAIPETFIRGLINNGIEPILHFHLSLDSPPDPEDLSLLFDVYANWGVHYVSLFKRPNCHDEWSVEKWVQQDLVERFLDIYLPLAESIRTTKMIPVFPPLEPGGDFWDTAFLRTALQSILQRGHNQLLDELVLGAYAWASNLPFNWGAGGPERWAGTRPYFTPPDEEDQMGFRIFDWYSTLCEAVLGNQLPILLLATGTCPGDQRLPNIPSVDAEEHGARNLQLARLLAGEKEVTNAEIKLDPVPEHILAGNFWLLAASPNTPEANASWYKVDGATLPVVQKFKAWVKAQKVGSPQTPQSKQGEPHQLDYKKYKPIKHYLLLPQYAWGVSNWHLEVTRPFIQKHMPTVGFSIEEACSAEKVTVVGDEDSFPLEVIEKLRAAGCNVNQIIGSGTSIATELEEL
jgi:hypothetical protein